MYQLLFAVLAFAPALLFAQDGLPDPNFDADGINTLNTGSNSDIGEGFAFDADGKMVLIGYYGGGSGQLMFTVRYNPDGGLDGTYGQGGIISISADDIDFGTCTAVQPDGKILMAGSSGSNSNSDQRMIIYRLIDIGLLDTTFNGTGINRVSNGTIPLLDINQMIVLDDGSILCVGVADGGSSGWDMAVIKLTPDGVLDTDFSFDGVVTVDFFSEGDIGFDIVQTANGKIVISGGSFNGSASIATLAQFNADGSLDNTFGTNGKVEINIGTVDNVAVSLAVLPNGKLAIANTVADDFADYDFGLTLLNADGSLDNSFGQNGSVRLQGSGISNSDAISDVVVQPDGKYLLCGTALSLDGGLVIRLNTDGSLDNTFGTGGLLVFNPTSEALDIRDAQLDDQGRLVMAGTYYVNAELDTWIGRILTGVSVGVLDQGNDFINPSVFPNPVTNGQLTLEYELVNHQEVSITLMDLQGKEISTLLEASRTSGAHVETLNFPSMLAKGYYLLQLQTAGGTTAVKVLVE